MASVERYRHSRVCLGKLFNRSKVPIIATPSSQTNQTFISDKAEASIVRVHSEIAQTQDTTPTNNRQNLKSCQQELYYESDSDSDCERPGRRRALCGCFGFSSSRHSNRRLTNYSGSRTTRTSTPPFRIDDIDAPPDSNITARSGNRIIDYTNGDPTDDTTLQPNDSRSGTSSFCSVISFSSDDGDCKINYINRSECLGTVSFSGNYFVPQKVAHDDITDDDFFSVDEGNVGNEPIYEPPTIEPPTIEPPTIESPTIEPPTIEPPTIESPTIESPTIESPTIESPTIESPTIEPSTNEPPSHDDTRTEDICLSTGESTRASPSFASLCGCGFEFHSTVYNPEFPLITGPDIHPNSHEECLAICNACLGCWETIVDRSESLDAQYRCLGLGIIKRSVMNRLAIPLTMFLEEEDSIFHCWIHTPLGIRHMRSNLYHHESVDEDPDAGRWSGTTSVVDFSISWYCNGKPVRALQQKRRNPSVGMSIETRCVLPDQEEGKIMLFQFVMIPKGKPETHQLKADRILKYTGPKKN